MVSGGLKEQWSLVDPQEGGRCEQAKTFSEDFRDHIQVCEAALGDTVTLASEADRKALNGKRDKAYTAYNKVLKRIDPNDEKKEQDNIKKTLGFARSVSDEAQSFRQDIEKAYEEWQNRAADYDSLLVRFDDLDLWGHPDLPLLAEGLAGIETAAQERRWADAVVLLDQSLVDIGPIHEDYQRQVDARVLYDQERTAFETRFTAAGKTDLQSEEVKRLIGQIETNLVAIDDDAGRLDFVAARDSLKSTMQELEGLEAAVRLLTEQQEAYLAAVGALSDRMTEADALPFPSLGEMRGAILEVTGKMEASALAHAFGDAMGWLGDATSMLDSLFQDAEALTKKKAEVEAMRDALALKLHRAGLSPYQEMKDRQKAIEAVAAEIDALIAEDKFDKASDALVQLSAMLEDFAEALALFESQSFYQQLEQELAPRLLEATVQQHAPLEKQQFAITAGAEAMRKKAKAQDFHAAYEEALAVERLLQDYDLALEDLEAQRAHYIERLGRIRAEIAEAFTMEGSAFGTLEKDITTLDEEMALAAAASDFPAALGLMEQIKDKLEEVYREKHDLLKVEEQQVYKHTKTTVLTSVNFYSGAVNNVAREFDVWVQPRLKKAKNAGYVLELLGAAAGILGVAFPVAGAIAGLTVSGLKILEDNIDPKADAKKQAKQLVRNMKKLGQAFINTYSADFSEKLMARDKAKWDLLAEYVVKGQPRQADEYLHSLGLPKPDPARGQKLMKALTAAFLKWEYKESCQDEIIHDLGFKPTYTIIPAADPNDPAKMAELEEKAGEIALELYHEAELELAN